MEKFDLTLFAGHLQLRNCMRLRPETKLIRKQLRGFLNISVNFQPLLLVFHYLFPLKIGSLEALAQPQHAQRSHAPAHVAPAASPVPTAAATGAPAMPPGMSTSFWPTASVRYLFPLKIGSFESLVGSDALLVPRGRLAYRAAAARAPPACARACRARGFSGTHRRCWSSSTAAWYPTSTWLQ